MTVNEYNELKEDVRNLELASAKAKGKMESIKENWIKQYGFSTLDEAKLKLKEMEDEKEKKNEAREKLMNDLKIEFEKHRK